MNTKTTARISLSIALASYNGERYISEQLDSIARQTCLPDELVVSDDASVDATRTIVLDFARRAPFPVRLLTNSERLGSTRNFEVAIRACGGDIIFLCDQDDVWYPDKMSLIKECFIANPWAGIVFTDADVVDQDLHPFGQLWKTHKFSPEKQARIAAGDALGVLLQRLVVTGATMAFRSSYRKLVLPMPDRWVHDAWIALLIGATSHLVALPIPLIAYRQHSANQIGVPQRGATRGKTCAEMYGPEVTYYNCARVRLLEFANRFPDVERQIHRFDEKLVFLRARAALPDSRWRRLPVILRELVESRYHHYANGLRSFRKDLLR